MKPNSDYIDIYTDGGLYDTLEYGVPYVQKGVRFAHHVMRGMDKGQKILCVGCGNGWEVLHYLNYGMDAYGTESHELDVPALKGRVVVALCPDLPFADQEFDLLHCTEVLEHIPVELTGPFLKECKRVGKKYLFSVATTADVFNSHINLHKPQWWLSKFDEAGFHIVNFQYRPILDLVMGNMLYNLTYRDGILIICR